MHGYIGVTPVELRVIDTAAFQRLRHIKQNATTYLTFPCASGTRFEHSLGTMHLASRMLAGALHNSAVSTQMRQYFLGRCAQEVTALLTEKGVDAGVKDHFDPNGSAEQLENAVQQALRAAGLLHDVGSPPFSHTSEQVMDDLLPHIYGEQEQKTIVELRRESDMAFHEVLGVLIMRADQELRDAGGLWVDIAEAILTEPPDSGTATRALRGILAGDIDADRADYLARDGRTSGSGFGGFDLDRVMDGMRLAHSDGSYRFCPTRKALSAVEGVVVERYKLYRWQGYHRRVVATNTILQEVLRRIIVLKKTCATSHPYSGLDLSMHHSRSDFIPPALHQHFFDDHYVIERLKAAYVATLSALDEPEETSLDEDSLLDMKLLLEEILFRRRSGLSLWKDASEYGQSNGTLLESFTGTIKEGDVLKGNVKHEEDMIRGMIEEDGYALNWLATKYLRERHSRMELEREANLALQSDDVAGFFLVNVTFFRPFNYGARESYDLYNDEDGTVTPLPEASPLILSLRDVNKKLQFFQAYVTLRDGLPTERAERVALRETAKNAMVSAIKTWFARTYSAATPS